MSRFKTTGDKLKEVLKLMDLCKNTIKITFSQNELIFNSMDASRTSLMNGSISYAMFDEYVGDGEEIYIDIKNFDSILKRAKKNAATLTIKGSVIEVTEKNTTWKVNQLAEGIKPPTPKFEPTNYCTLSAEQFNEEMSRVLDEGDFITLEMDSQHLKLSCNDDTKKDIIVSNIPLTEFSSQEYIADVKSSFGSNFFETLMKDITKTSKVQLGIGTDYPLLVRIFSDDGLYTVDYYVAPRVEQD